MKNSNIELLGEFLSHTPDPQSNYEKRELLYPISKQFDFEVDFKRILFREETPEKAFQSVKFLLVRFTAYIIVVVFFIFYA